MSGVLPLVNQPGFRGAQSRLACYARCRSIPTHQPIPRDVPSAGAAGCFYPPHKEKTEMDTENDQLETKAGIAHDAVGTHADMMRVLEDCRDANGERLHAAG